MVALATIALPRAIAAFPIDVLQSLTTNSGDALVTPRRPRQVPRKGASFRAELCCRPSVCPIIDISSDVDKNSPIKLERIEIMPEADGRVRIMVSAKKEQD